MISIQRISASQQAYLPDLCTLLLDTVQQGASVGFLAPLSQEKALNYWQNSFATLSSGICLWVAIEGKQIVGSVQLSLCQKENGMHRAEIQKLFVLSAARGKGIASMLMQKIESFAVENGRSLLVLDTQTGSQAEQIYRHLGWQKAGEIPDFAASPDGSLHGTSYYYKNLVIRNSKD